MRQRQEEILRVTRIPEIPFIRIVSGSAIVNDFAKHIHSDICVGIVTSGERIISVMKRAGLLEKNDIFVINKSEPHTCTSNSKRAHSYRVIVIDSGFISGIANELSGSPDIVFENFIKGDTELSERMLELLDTLLNSDMTIEKESRLYSFIEMLIRYHSDCKGIHDSSKKTSPIEKVREYIDANFRDQISLAELSQISAVSPFHFNRLFCSEVGISPHTYQIHRRIEMSKKLLLENVLIADVSLEMGFSDQSHFSKFFKKIVGTTPGNFVRCNRK